MSWSSLVFLANITADRERDEISPAGGVLNGVPINSFWTRALHETVQTGCMSFESWCPVWARERCRISPHRFLAECCKRQLNHGSFVLLYFRLLTFSDLY